MKTLRTLLLVLVPFIANTQTSQSIFDLLSNEDYTAVNMELDWSAVTSDLRNEDKHHAHLTFKDAEGTKQAWDIKVKLRGKFRRMKCTETPPFKLYFDKKDLASAGLTKHNDLKLVNFCYSDKEIAKDILLKEYLAYKMYGAITDISYRVQLLKITYKDTVTGDKIKQWAFLIEDTAQVRDRLSADKLSKDELVHLDSFDKNQVRIMALFQYMIGNADWKLQIEKNVKIIKQKNQLLAIPYDFDFSGFVNAPYARPNSNYSLTSVKDRIYLGFPKDVIHLDPTIDLFESKKKTLYKLVKTQKHLSWDSKVEIFSYLDEFFNELNVKNIVRTVPIEDDTEERSSTVK